jgi:hypothetical protein
MPALCSPPIPHATTWWRPMRHVAAVDVRPPSIRAIDACASPRVRDATDGHPAPSSVLSIHVAQTRCCGSRTLRASLSSSQTTSRARASPHAPAHSRARASNERACAPACVRAAMWLRVPLLTVPQDGPAQDARRRQDVLFRVARVHSRRRRLWSSGDSMAEWRGADHPGYVDDEALGTPSPFELHRLCHSIVVPHLSHRV